MQTSELIGRLEAARGADWRLDVLLAGLLYPGDKDMCKAATQGRWNPTASIDAALTLVPEGCMAVFHLFNHREGFWECDLGSIGADFRGQASIPALALCIAALRARNEGEG